MGHPRRDVAAMLAERRYEWTPYQPPEWFGDALCAEVDPALFFPKKGGSTRDAMGICGRCEVRETCLEYALDHGERHGIWGGKSERDRRKIERLREAS